MSADDPNPSSLLSHFTLREAEDASDAKLLGDVRTFGWHVVQIWEEQDSPAFAFTVGLFYRFSQPEILVMGLDLSVAANLLNTIGEAMRNGRRFNPGRHSGLIDALDIELRPIDLSHYEEYLGYASWFYRSFPRPFPALQCIWPDKEGRFPGENEYDTRYLTTQKVLS